MPLIRFLLPLPLIALLLILSACQSSNVIVDYDTDADFSNLRYYRWLEERSGAEESFDPLIAERAKSAVQAQLQQAGFDPATDTNPANVLVRYYVATYTRSQQSNTQGSIGFGSSGKNTALGISLSFPLGGDKIIKDAQIIVDLLSADDQLLKWRGTNTFQISDESPEQITHMIEAVVAEIFSHYPPGAPGAETP